MKKVYLKTSSYKKDIELSENCTLKRCKELVESHKKFLIGLNEQLKDTKHDITEESEEGFTYTITRERVTNENELKKEVIKCNVYIK